MTSASWILTAQHCVNEDGIISEPALVVAGSTTLSGSNNRQIRTADEVIAYPGWGRLSRGKPKTRWTTSSTV